LNGIIAANSNHNQANLNRPTVPCRINKASGAITRDFQKEIEKVERDFQQRTEVSIFKCSTTKKQLQRESTQNKFYLRRIIFSYQTFSRQQTYLNWFGTTFTLCEDPIKAK